MRSSLVAAVLSGCTMPIGVGFDPRAARVNPLDPVDGDGDGISVTEGDCDDHNALVDPTAYDDCDGIDNDCDGLVDEMGCHRYDDFTQSLQTDVLFVLDRSTSMLPYVGRIAAEADHFLGPLVGPLHHTHVAVMTMDARSTFAGLLTGPDDGEWIDGDATTLPDATQWLREVLSTSGGPATILPEARAAVANELLPDVTVERMGGVGMGAVDFLRPDAALHVVFVSDRDDASIEPTVLDFVDALDAVSETHRHVIHAVVETDVSEPCGAYGESFLDMSVRTLGVPASICAADYAFLSSMTEKAAADGLRTRFELSAVPADGEPVVVEITYSDGTVAVLPDKMYQVDDGVLAFHAGGIPEVGAEIRVDYEIDPFQ